MEPLEYLDALEKLYGIDGVVRETITKVKTQKELCTQLQKHIDVIMKTGGRMRNRAAYSGDVKRFVDEVTAILKDTESVVNNLANVNLAQKVIMGRKYENQINALMKKYTQISKTSMFQNLTKIYSDKPLKSSRFCATWELPFDRACIFCHVTQEGHIIVGGQRPGKENMFQLRACDPYGNDVWHWQCPEELGEPSDITQVTVKGPRGENQNLLAIVCENVGKVILFDPEIRSIIPKPAFTVTDPEYRLRRIARLMRPQRVVVSLDPAITASPNLKSQIKVLSCDHAPFTELWTIKLDCIDTHVISPITHGEVAVVCHRPEKISVYRASEGESRWHLEPPTLNGKRVLPEGLCTIGGDLCVYDSSDQRLVAASEGRWGDMLLRGLGENVYSITWHPHVGKIVVLHNRDGSIRITLFDIIR